MTTIVIHNGVIYADGKLTNLTEYKYNEQRQIIDRIEFENAYPECVDISEICAADISYEDGYPSVKSMEDGKFYETSKFIIDGKKIKALAFAGHASMSSVIIDFIENDYLDNNRSNGKFYSPLNELLKRMADAQDCFIKSAQFLMKRYQPIDAENLTSDVLSLLTASMVGVVFEDDSVGFIMPIEFADSTKGYRYIPGLYNKDDIVVFGSGLSALRTANQCTYFDIDNPYAYRYLTGEELPHEMAKTECKTPKDFCMKLMKDAASLDAYTSEVIDIVDLNR